MVSTMMASKYNEMAQENYAHLVKLEKGDKKILRRDDFESLMLSLYMRRSTP